MNVAMTTAREILRHLLYKSGAYGLLSLYRSNKGVSPAHLRDAEGPLKSRFSGIYETGAWQHGDDATPGSGEGSTLAATTGLREALPSLLSELNVHTLLDIGCGDFTWMQHGNLQKDYIGVDVVDSVIEKNRQLYERPGRIFAVADATVDELPEADAALCREVLFHLSFDDINKLLKNVLSKKRSFLIITSDTKTWFNSDIPTGDFRPLNLEAWPLRFPPPDRVIDDAAVSPGRIIGVWNTANLAGLLR